MTENIMLFYRMCIHTKQTRWGKLLQICTYECMSASTIFFGVCFIAQLIQCTKALLVLSALLKHAENHPNAFLWVSHSTPPPIQFPGYEPLTHSPHHTQPLLPSSRMPQIYILFQFPGLLWNFPLNQPIYYDTFVQNLNCE